MGDITRQTIIFFLPLQLEAIMGIGSSNPHSITGSDGNNVSENNGDPLWARRQLYINPQSLNIRDSKLIKSDLTKGGYVTQYWGEALTKLEVGGTTGSSGIEGINVLRDIYRHEQIQYREVLRKRQERLAEEAKRAAAEAEALLEERTGVGGTLLNIGDTLTGGALSDTINGVSNAVDIIAAPFLGDGTAANYTQFKSVPSLAAFATNVDMYYQGEFFRGYFENFSVTENGSEPGHFTYQFTYAVTRRTGRRENFMPWHREPLTYDGETRMSQSTTSNKGMEGAEALSFPITDTRDPPEMYGDSLSKRDSRRQRRVNSKFKDENSNKKDKNDIPVNRNKHTSGGS
jgi:hypothetical protein